MLRFKYILIDNLIILNNPDELCVLLFDKISIRVNIMGL